MQRQSKYQDFWAFVDRTEPLACWLWRGFTGHDGYGQFSEYGVGAVVGRRRQRQRRTVRAHVRAYELATGMSVPLGTVIRHSCDRPACCNPAHLLAGTQRDNILDAVQRRRHRSGNQRLSDADVLVIRQRVAAGENQTLVARSFGVAASTVCHIVHGDRRRHCAETIEAQWAKTQCVAV